MYTQGETSWHLTTKSYAIGQGSKVVAAVLEVLVDPAGSVHSHTGQQLKQKAGKVACSKSQSERLLSAATAMTHQTMRQQYCSMRLRGKAGGEGNWHRHHEHCLQDWCGEMITSP